MIFQKVAIIGVGLIGASLGKALLKRGIARSVTGVGRSQKNLETARETGCVTEIADSAHLRTAIRGAEVVVLCTPVGAIVPTVRECAEFCDSGTIFTDAGSTKSQIVRDLETLPSSCTFLGGHPIAGKETSGASEADENLYEGKVTILTPTPATSESVLERVHALWTGVGSRVVILSPDEHDTILAAVSHLPHVISCALSSATPPALLPYAGTGYQSVARLSSGSVEVWRDILLANRCPILESIRTYEDHLARLRTLLESGDEGGLEEFLKNAHRE